jgi:hypothetical protein
MHTASAQGAGVSAPGVAADKVGLGRKASVVTGGGEVSVGPTVAAEGVVGRGLGAEVTGMLVAVDCDVNKRQFTRVRSRPRPIKIGVREVFLIMAS